MSYLSIDAAGPVPEMEPSNEENVRNRKRAAPCPLVEQSLGFLSHNNGENNQEGASNDDSRSPFLMLQCANVQTVVCFGTICDVPIQIRNDPRVPNEKLRMLGPLGLEIRARATAEGFWVRLAQGELFACLAKKAAQGLKALGHYSCECVQIEGIISSAALIEARNDWKRTGKSKTGIDVNIYGHPHVAKNVGDSLMGQKLFLQAPTADLRALAYDNPQCLPLPSVLNRESSTEIVDRNEGNSADILLSDLSKSGIDAILGDMPQPSFLREVFVDAHIRTALVKHQKEALDFMNRRETGELPPTMSLWRRQHAETGSFFYQNVITGAKNDSIEEPIGGILADDMGLGKTLTTLAVIVGSLRPALDFASENTRADSEKWRNNVPSKSTLVIVPSSLLLDSWTEEIEKHIHPGTITSCRYHGAGRSTAMMDLLTHDIVLTTYATIAAEFCRGQSMMHRIKWYRIVLDEAHVVRNTSTKQFRAIHSLSAYKRWCITGTPIQNSLDDLSALMRFLRTPILDDQKLFRKHVINPVLSRGSGRFTNLRQLLEALCLRRTKSLLRLPEPLTETHMLDLSESESQAYHDFGDSCRRAINLAVSGHSLKKANHHVIQAILGMRLFCNEGPLAFVGKCKANGLPTDPDEALSYLESGEESRCVHCGTEVATMYQSGDPSSGVLTNCQHLICAACLPEIEARLDGITVDGRTRCPFCDLHTVRHSFFLDPTIQESCDQRKFCSTKVLALLEEILGQKDEDKSVIFSFWKKSLDIVAELFEVNKIAFFRIHGSLPSGKRARILADFEKSTSIKVLLITFGTGGVGINKLMSANQIHILEPQWNPSIESQAIGRVLRFGQERCVRIVRYIMKQTVEEAVQSQQLRKLQLAHGGFSLSTDRIMNLICPAKPENETTFNYNERERQTDVTRLSERV